MNKELTVIGFGIVLMLLSLIAWLSHVSDSERERFESGVLIQHSAFHKMQQDMLESLKAYIDVKSDDRFTGSDGLELELRMQSQIDDLRDEESP